MTYGQHLPLPPPHRCTYRPTAVKSDDPADVVGPGGLSLLDLAGQVDEHVVVPVHGLRVQVTLGRVVRRANDHRVQGDRLV